ncbi:MAG: elongation factor P hydroxylase [Porticoccaceae bacterium]|nr:elongation factor P hydroxylase [Porticoccaceae bacterium]
MVLIAFNSENPPLTMLVNLFDALFYASHHTRLIAGADEPVYLPAQKASGPDYHRLCFREDYFSSALHEIAHWCLAGQHRRQLEDFGYWYQPDGRNAEQQQRFEAAEIKPQALEWMFSVACGQSFQLSVDNLSSGQSSPSAEFAQSVVNQARLWCVPNALPVRAEQMLTALAEIFDAANPKDRAHYQ